MINALKGISGIKNVIKSCKRSYPIFNGIGDYIKNRYYHKSLLKVEISYQKDLLKNGWWKENATEKIIADFFGKYLEKYSNSS